MALGIKPTVDFAFKKIFGSQESVQALIGLLNAILELPAPITDVEILNPFSYKEFTDDKLIILDVRARDTTGRMLNIEMQVSNTGDLKQRLTYYACKLYADQLQSGYDYYVLQPAISICLLSHDLFRETRVPHHRFRFSDLEHGRELGVPVEVHTVELLKYNLPEETIGQASKIEQWAFFLLNADQYDPDALRALLPGVEFEQAITIIETISQKEEDRNMYDQRERAQREYQWGLDGARREALEEGLEKGLEKGQAIGTIATLQGIVGEPVTDVEELKKLDEAELNHLCADLQDRLRSRGSS
jgi:predicted transposase/invertase (TIGR01784 family)